ncbi:MAG: IS3 family transposase, partial [Verrucomicrobiales bacterium]
RITGDFIGYYNTIRLHSAIGYIAPVDRLHGRQHQIHAARDKKLEDARHRRKMARQTTFPTPRIHAHQTIPAIA